MTLAARLLSIIALALLPPLVIQVWTGMEQRQERQAAVRTEALAQARAVQADVARLAEGVRQLLVALAGSPALYDGNAACAAYLAGIAQEAREYVLLGANGPDGAIICNSQGSERGSYSNAERAYFKRARASGGFSAGDLVRGVVTGRDTIHFALPFRRADGALGGYVLAGLDRERVERQLAAAALPTGAAALLVDPSGTVVAEVKDGRPGSWTGQPAPPALLAAMDAGVATTLELPGSDGRPRVFGVRPADPTLSGLRTAVALDPARATGDIARAAWRNAAALAAGVALAFGVGTIGARRLVLRPLRRLTDAADRVGRGELGALTGLRGSGGGLQEVGHAFDRMSGALLTREAERDIAESARLEGEARYKALFEAIDQGFCVIEVRFGPNGVGEDYRFLEVNPAFAAQTGLMNAEGRWASEVIPNLERHWPEAYGRVAATGESARFESVAGGLERWFSVSAFRVGRSGRYRVAILFDDISDRRRAEEAMRRAKEDLEARVEERTRELHSVIAALHDEALEREDAEARLRQSHKMDAVGQLTGGIAHDFNNMLQAISGSIELLRRRIAAGRTQDAGRLLDGARQSVDRAAALTNRLLAFARRQALDPRLVDPDALVHGMQELIRGAMPPSVTVRIQAGRGAAPNTATEAEGETGFEAGSRGWSVRCDSNQLESALLNLSINARDAMPEGGILTIGSAAVEIGAEQAAAHEGAETGQYVALSVTDTGQGMDPATQARAFEPFFTTKPLGQGTGLGLSQTYGFVRQSGGFVRLASSPGAGTVVTLYLPRHRTAAIDPPPPPEQPASPPPGAHVLLVEDDPDVRAGVSEHLRELGYEVDEAPDGAAALAALAAPRPHGFDALVTDVGLPGGMNGRQLADAARELRPGLPVLFITGYAGGALDERLDPGMAVIGKPFTLDALAARLAALLNPTS